MVVWVVIRVDNLRTTIARMYDTRDAAVDFLESVAANLQVELLDEGNGVYFVGLQEYNVDRHRLYLSNRIGVKKSCLQMAML